MSNKNKYSQLSPEEYDSLFKNFLINSWSYSKVTSFSRNEKAFEMNYIYNVPSRKSASSVSGNAYHSALDHYFTTIKEENKILDIVDLQTIAFEYVDDVKSNEWKLQKTTPNVEKCRIKANTVANSLLENFFGELSNYDFKEIIAVEKYFDQFVTVNGVDIPLPCHAKIDLIAKTHDGKIVIIDHKSKNKFSDEKELSFTIGKQAMTYYLVLEAELGLEADEVWFIENKYSKNRDKSPQLNCFKMAMDDDTKRLYGAMLYEPLKRMIEAVSDADYVYLMNDNDNFIDIAEISEFWAHTMSAEVDDFNIDESKRDIIGKRLKKIRDASLSAINPSVIKNFRKNASNFIEFDLSNKDMTIEEKIEHVLRTLNLTVKVAHKFEGFSNNTYLLQTQTGTNLSSVFKYKMDIANALDVPSIRIKKDLFIWEGKSYLAIESPKKRTEDLYFHKKYLVDYKIPIGLDNFKNTVFWDLENHSTPHVLMCGATGSGKSVSIISIVEYAKAAGIKDIVIFDPKFEFTKYSKQKNIDVYNDIQEIEEALESMVTEMNNRVVNKVSQLKLVVFDEFADALSQSRKGKELEIKQMVEVGLYQPKKDGAGGYLPQLPKMKMQVVETKKSLEENLKILLQKGRSLGFRIIAATQRASVKVITGDAKVNFPVQICFRVPKEVDSKVVLDEGGAETLTGRGDGLINSPEHHDLVRFQSFYKKN